MTGTELDEILAEETTQENVEQNNDEGQTRDEHGRFAAKAEETEQAKPQEQPEAEQNAEPEPGEDGKVPQKALHAARQQAKDSKQEADQLRQQLAQMQGQIQMLTQQMAQPRQPEAPKEVPDFWENPEEFVKTALTPVQQQQQQRLEQFSQMMAVEKYGEETVNTAFQALAGAMQAGDPSAQGTYQRIMGSPHPYGALVEWHKQAETLKQVGSDPSAYFDAEFERRMADPAFMAKITERVQGAATQNSRSNPVTNLPPSLNGLPAGTNKAEDLDTSDAALFRHAMG